MGTASEITGIIDAMDRILIKPKGNSWYEIKAKADSAEIFLYDEIGGWGIGAKQFIDELRALDGLPLTLRIHSPGGSVLDGHAIYSALKRHDGQITVAIDGLAASMASVIAMAGDRVTMAENGFIMIHNPSGMAMGESDDMRKAAELLDKMRDGLVNIYVARTKMPVKKIEKMMDEETWMNSTDARGMGFIDDVTEEIDIAAKFDLSKFAHLPRALVDTTKTHMATKTTLEVPIDELTQLRADSASLVALTAATKVFEAERTALHERLSDLACKIAEKDVALATKDARITSLEAEVASIPAKVNEGIQRSLAATGHPQPVPEGAPKGEGKTEATWAEKLAAMTPAERTVAMKIHRQEIFAEYRGPQKQSAVTR